MGFRSSGLLMVPGEKSGIEETTFLPSDLFNDCISWILYQKQNVDTIFNAIMRR
jgi:hypothetical protein